MEKFLSNEIQILVSTTIIESGIDIHSANTIIIADSSKMGLATLHQLRGRVGRGDVTGYAYFFYPKKHELSYVQQQRLMAIDRYSNLGSGMEIATKDLHIRGAGSLVGERQSGHINYVGYNLYLELINSTAKFLSEEDEHNIVNDKKLDDMIFRDLSIKLDFDYRIPDVYIDSQILKLDIYYRISNCKSLDVLDSLKVELIERFGSLPSSVKDLFEYKKFYIYIYDKFPTISNITQNEKSLIISKIPFSREVVQFFDFHYSEKDQKLTINIPDKIKSSKKMIEFIKSVL
jgi:transcription-repair coupling factor (superfamily II helicase)